MYQVEARIERRLLPGFYALGVSSPQSISDRVIALLDRAFDSLASADVPLSEAAFQATRIARLRNDFDNLFWLELEQRAIGSRKDFEALLQEFAGHYGSAELEALNKRVGRVWIEDRTTELPAGLDVTDTKEQAIASSLKEIEAQLATVGELTQGAEIPEGMHTLDVHAAFKEKQKLAVFATRSKQGYKRVLDRVERRVRIFLSDTEKQVAFGQVNAGIFERNRRYVDEQLAKVAPRALEQVSSAYKRANEDGAEARSQALLSCRRTLKSVADVLCPASDTTAEDADGGEHSLADDKWRNRLVEFVKQKVGSAVSGDVLRTQLDDLGRRFKGLGEASSRGVHADVTEFELNQAVIQTYLTVGDLLRLHADDSGLSVVAQGLIHDPTGAS
jgi:hypothetical protein